MADAEVDWSERAEVAERALVRRHLRPVAGVVPGTVVARERWPRTLTDPPALRWHLWWQAQFLECLGDAQQRSPTAERARVIAALVRGIRLRNRGVWTARRVGDAAWLGVALHRVGGHAGVGAVGAITEQLYRSWSEHAGGGLWNRRGSTSVGVKSAHVNGPAAILMARSGQVEFAGSIADWMTEALLDPDTGLVRAGVRVGPDAVVGPSAVAADARCQGGYLGACVELSRRDDHQRWGDRAVALVDAVLNRFAHSDGSLPGAGGGNGGLFAGVLARSLADAALHRPELECAAAGLVLASAKGAWDERVDTADGPVFSPEWGMPAMYPRRRLAEADLSVQLAGWMLLESAARLQRAGCLPD